MLRRWPCKQGREVRLAGYVLQRSHASVLPYSVSPGRPPGLAFDLAPAPARIGSELSAPAGPGLSGLDGQLDRAYITLTKGLPTTFQLSSQTIADRIWLTLEYPHRVDLCPVCLQIVESLADGSLLPRDMTAVGSPDRTGHTHRIPVGTLLEPGEGFDTPEPPGCFQAVNGSTSVAGCRWWARPRSGRRRQLPCGHVSGGWGT